jgi:hypothetical protein
MYPKTWRDLGLKVSAEVLSGQFQVAENALEDLGVENLPCVVRNRHPYASRVAEYPMAPARPDLLKAEVPKDAEHLRRGDPR